MRIGDTYKHYKGGLYKIYNLATDSETKETVVIYRSMDTKKLYARPLKMFDEMMSVNDRTVPRFEKVEDGSVAWQNILIYAIVIVASILLRYL